MWTLHSRELMEHLLGAGGERLVQFVDALIRAEARVGGLPQDRIHTQVRATIPDGGVDTHVDGPVPTDQSGFLADATCWQYKAQLARDISDSDLKAEINKPYATAVIQSGCSYRFCIAGDLTPETRAHWEQVLGVESSRINSRVPSPRVVAVDKIAEWASRFPFISGQIRALHPSLFGLDTWSQNAVAVTRQYVPVPDRANVVRLIERHCDFLSTPIEACLVIQGQSGVGKTRLVFESLRSIIGIEAIVAYTGDEKLAREVATTLAATPHVKGVLVSDECTLETRQFLNEHLRGHIHRIRVIAIDNSATRLSGLMGTPWLERMPEGAVSEILARNFPQVPQDRRSRFVEISRGFVRFAAELCRHYMIDPTGHLTGVVPNVQAYLAIRLGSDGEVVEALSLFTKVGHREEVGGELAALSEATGIPVDRFHQVVDWIKDSPGFVAVAGRYWYVTPAIIADAAFDRAWGRWVRGSIQGFLGNLPPTLVRGFLDRARVYGGEEVRSALAAHFREWVNSITTADLGDANRMDLLATLVEADPGRFLPLLRTTVEHAATGELRRIHDENVTGSRSGRRPLVWLCERLAAFPEYFEDAEAILFKLACEESEPNLGNNASAIWRQFFRIQLSGTAVPFEQRICLLGERITQASNETLLLVFSAARGILESGGARMVGPAIVAGRIPPSDWAPQDRSEYRVCLEKTLDLIRREAGTASTDHRSLALRTLLDAIRPVLDSGLLDEARECVEAARLNNDERDRILEALDDYTYLHRRYGGDEKSTTRWKEYLAKVESWAESLRPEDLVGQVRALISRNEWDEGLRGEKGGLSPQVSNLAAEIKDNPRKLDHVLDWLNSDQALSAAVFGAALGEADQDGILIPRILGSLVVSGKPALGRGYVHGLARRHAHTLRDVNPYLDELEAKQPSAAFEIACAAGDSVDGANRAVRLADAGVVPVVSLSALAYRVGTREVQAEELQAILSRLVAASERGDSTAQSAALSILSLHIHMDKKDRPDRPLLDSRFKDLAWGLLEGGPPQRGGIDAHHWGMVLEWVAPAGPARAAKAATMTLLGNVYSVHDVATEFLSHWAGAFPDEVMDAFGEALMDPDKGYMIQIPIYGNLISQLPAESVIRWLQAQGVDGARRLARHLPPPRLDVLGNPVVPPVLEYVLREYEDDDEVFRAFVIGCHGTEVWVGDRSDKLRQEAAIARRFLSHPLRRVREWAKSESVSRERMADWEKQQFDEHWLP